MYQKRERWLEEQERASLAASHFNLVSPRSARYLPCDGYGDYPGNIPLAGSDHMPRPTTLHRTGSTRSVGRQVLILMCYR